MPRGWLLPAILLLTALRLVVAWYVPLAPDEAYYWVWSHALAPGYLDHPPMVALWIAAGTALVGKTALGVRLLGPLGCAAASWCLYDAGRRLFPETQAGSTATWLLNASLLLGVGAVIITPDTPLLVFWTMTLWAAARIATGGAAGWWLAAGLFAGLALLSKYTAAFLWIGLGAWVLLTPSMRPWLRRWQPYAGALLGAALFVPVLVWNARHDWAGLLRQGGRVTDWNPSRALSFLGELIGGQFGLATPVIFVLCMIALGVALRRAWRGEAGWSLLAAFSLPPVLVFLQHAIGDRVQGNWPAIIYPALVLAVGGMAPPPVWVRRGVAVGLGITLLAYLQAAFLLIPLRAKSDPVRLRLAGWPAVAARIDAADHGPVGYVAVEGYAPASELAWWARSGVLVLGANDRRWRLTDLPRLDIGGQPGLLLRDAGTRQAPDPALWRHAERLETVERTGSGGRDLILYRVTAAPGTVLSVLPAR